MLQTSEGSVASPKVADHDDAAATSIHLCVVLHGLWGSPAHVDYIKESLLAHQGEPTPAKESDDGDAPDTSADQALRPKLVVLVSEANSLSSGHLYDGIDVCAERVVEEIDAEIGRLEREEPAGKVTKFSLVGYSLGGLVARYVLGLLDSRSPSFFASIEPVNFTTFASPALGMLHYDGLFPSWQRYLGTHYLSRTGKQIHERDSFLPRDFQVPRMKRGASPQSGKARTETPTAEVEGEPLLKIMADPRYSFYRALCKFERVDIYANTLNDRSVPFCTAALEPHDPFALARQRAVESAQSAGEPVTDDLDLAKGGLKVSFREGAPILDSYEVAQDPEDDDAAAAAAAGALAVSRSRWPSLRFTLPQPLRPSTYPVSRPKALVVIGLLPVIWPVAMSILATRSLVHVRQSQSRIRVAQDKIGGGADGWLARVGIRLEEMVERSTGLEGEELLAASTGADAGAASAIAERAVGEAEDDILDGGHTDEAPPEEEYVEGRTSSTSSTSTLAAGDDPTATPLLQAESAALPVPSPVRVRLREPRPPTDPILSDSQLFQLEHLNAIPQLRKHFVHMPEVYWSHGAIIRRDRNFKQHEKGVLVVDSWARDFQLWSRSAGHLPSASRR